VVGRAATDETLRETGSLYAKCAVADGERLLVSARTNRVAHWFDIDLGLLVEGGDVPRRVRTHFDALFLSGHFAEASTEISG
jgi:hypothetical protein